ncbi:Hypothetical predicted protein, partial [Paramuricea clavata]
MAELNQVRATLLKVADQISALGSNKSSSETTSSRPPESEATTSSSSSTASNAASEHRRLFNFGKTRHLVTKSKGKQSTKGKGKQPATKFKFVCLADSTTNCPPLSVKEKTDLCNAGLGDTTILLELNDSSVYLHEEVLKTFPKLSDTGGYELLLHQRGGGENGGFHTIKPPLCSLRLKDVCGKAKIYVRPLQRNIPLDSFDDEIPEEENE